MTYIKTKRYLNINNNERLKENFEIINIKYKTERGFLLFLQTFENNKRVHLYNKKILCWSMFFVLRGLQ